MVSIITGYCLNDMPNLVIVEYLHCKYKTTCAVISSQIGRLCRFRPSPFVIPGKYLDMIVCNSLIVISEQNKTKCLRELFSRPNLVSSIVLYRTKILKTPRVSVNFISHVTSCLGFTRSQTELINLRISGMVA